MKKNLIAAIMVSFVLIETASSSLWAVQYRASHWQKNKDLKKKPNYLDEVI